MARNKTEVKEGKPLTICLLSGFPSVKSFISLVTFAWNHPFNCLPVQLLVAKNLLNLLRLLAAIGLSLLMYFLFFMLTAIVNVWVTAKFFFFLFTLWQESRKSQQSTTMTLSSRFPPPPLPVAWMR